MVGACMAAWPGPFNYLIKHPGQRACGPSLYSAIWPWKVQITATVQKHNVMVRGQVKIMDHNNINYILYYNIQSLWALISYW